MAPLCVIEDSPKLAEGDDGDDEDEIGVGRQRQGSGRGAYLPYEPYRGATADPDRVSWIQNKVFKACMNSFLSFLALRAEFRALERRLPLDRGRAVRREQAKISPILE